MGRNTLSPTTCGVFHAKIGEPVENHSAQNPDCAGACCRNCGEKASRAKKRNKAWNPTRAFSKATQPRVSTTTVPRADGYFGTRGSIWTQAVNGRHVTWAQGLARICFFTVLRSRGPPKKQYPHLLLSLRDLILESGSTLPCAMRRSTTAWGMCGVSAVC